MKALEIKFKGGRPVTLVHPLDLPLVLYNLLKHDVGFHCFIAFLNTLRLSSCFIFELKFPMFLDPRNFILSMPLKTLCTDGS